MSENGTGMASPANPTPAGAVTSEEATRKNPKQGFRSGLKIDRNRHGIRRETSTGPKPPKKTRPKKV